MKFHLPTINQFASMLMLTITNAVFQLLVLPIIIHNTNVHYLGNYFLALSFASLLSILVNYGTSQTSLVAIKRAKNEIEKNKVIAETIALRFFPLLIALFITILLPLFISHGYYYLLVLPMIIAEFFNPQFYLLATFNIAKYAIANLILRVAFIVILYLNAGESLLVEMTLLGTGVIMLVLNLCYLKKIFLKKEVLKQMPGLIPLQKLYKTNSLVLGNGLTVHLQQSMYLFALPQFVSPLFLSAYGFIDKLISSFRMLVNAYASALMPEATVRHGGGTIAWKKLRKQQNILLAIVCSIIGLIMYCFPNELLTILMMGNKKNDLHFFVEAAKLIKIISVVPFLIALNVFNVAEIFLENKYGAYFGSGVLLLFISLLYIDALKLGLSASYAGYYPILIEGSALIISYLVVQKIRNAKN